MAKAQNKTKQGLSASIKEEVEIIEGPLKEPRKFSIAWIIQATLISLVILLIASGYSILNAIGNDPLKARSLPYELEANRGVSYVVHDLLDDKYPPFLISLWVQLNADDYRGIQRGFYVIDGKISIKNLLEKMKRGEVYVEDPQTLPIAEGMQFELILKRMMARGDLQNDLIVLKDVPAFIQKTLESKELIEAIGGVHDSLEGLLLPATYPYYKDNTASDIIAYALKDMAQYMLTSWPSKDDGLELKDPYEALILASLVERESAIAEEMPQIASVFYNRLKKGMRLQTDPAVMYGVSPLFRGPLRASQLKKDTPYNTYTRAGLPPTPIAMPSKNAIDAVLHPANSKAIFFVAKSHDPKDGHVFSDTLDEHNSAVAVYKKRVREYLKETKNSK